MAAPIYRGFSSQDVVGFHTEKTDIELVKIDLLNHFMTRRGERVGRAGFYSIIHDLHLDQFDERTEILIRNDAERIFAADPRVKPLEINLSLEPDLQSIRLEAKLQFVEFNMTDWFDVTFRGNPR